MRISSIAVAAALGILAPLAASAADVPPTIQPASVQKDQPLICHYYYHEGMLIGRPDCRTADQWTHRQLDDQRFLREFQMLSLIQHN